MMEKKNKRKKSSLNSLIILNFRYLRQLGYFLFLFLMKKSVALLLLIGLCLACQSQKPINQSIEPIEIITLRENSLIQFDSILLINNEIEYGKVTNQMNATRFPGIPFKSVDFSNQSVVLINLDMTKAKTSTYKIIPEISDQQLKLKLKEQKNEQFDDIPKKQRFIQLLEIPKVNSIEKVEFIP